MLISVIFMCNSVSDFKVQKHVCAEKRSGSLLCFYTLSVWDWPLVVALLLLLEAMTFCKKEKAAQ